MAQLTPKDILEISEPIEAIYQRTVDDLLVNIARHFNITGWERTRYWEIKKLSEMGALTKESAAIIAKNTKRTPEEIERAFLEVSQKACLDIDPQLKDAAAKGILQDPGTSATTSPLMRQMVQGYVDQAVDTLNMVNSTMLESTLRAYQQAIQTAVNEAMVQEAKEILEAGALEVVTGQETKVRAIRKAMDQMARAGIPGFYDSRGRAWSPDGYVAMVIRTTSHNAAIKAVQNRQMEYGGGDIFQVSSHPGARPLCYPYQGKFFSWSSGPGEFTDGSGKTQHYDNINDSSYGEPAGLFGINCGHHPIPMIPGYSYPQDGPEQDEEENKKEYEESQKQRQYERQIREAKRDLEVAKATGDEEAVKAAKQKVAQEQAKIRAYTKETGRVRRYDREQIGSLVDTDYGMRDLRKQKVDEDLGGAAAKKAAAKKKPASTYTPAKDVAEAERKAEHFVDPTGWAATGVSYKGVDVEVANAVNKTLQDFYDEFKVDKFGGVIAPAGNTKEGKLIENATAAYSPVRNSFMLNRSSLKNMKTAEKALAEERRVVTDFLEHPEKYDLDKLSTRARKVLEASAKSGRGNVAETVEDVISHELGHSLESQLKQLANFSELQARMAEYAEGISGYATESWSEYVAESFASWRKGESVADPELIKAFESLRR